jgi:hypothetical protein
MQVLMACRVAICVVSVSLGSAAVGHHVIEDMPVVLADRLVTLLVDAREAGQFSSDLPSDCIPKDCLTALLSGLEQDDMEWLNTASEAKIPSSHFGRLPASMTVRFLRDLHDLLPKATRAGPLAAQAQRLEGVLLSWSE